MELRVQALRLLLRARRFLWLASAFAFSAALVPLGLFLRAFLCLLSAAFFLAFSFAFFAFAFFNTFLGRRWVLRRPEHGYPYARPSWEYARQAGSTIPHDETSASHSSCATAAANCARNL